MQCHPDKNGGKVDTAPHTYIQILDDLKEQLDLPTNYFFIVLEPQAVRLTHGIPPPRILYRPGGTRMTLPTVDFTECIQM